MVSSAVVIHLLFSDVQTGKHDILERQPGEVNRTRYKPIFRWGWKQVAGPAGEQHHPAEILEAGRSTARVEVQTRSRAQAREGRLGRRILPRGVFFGGSGEPPGGKVICCSDGRLGGGPREF